MDDLGALSLAPIGDLGELGRVDVRGRAASLRSITVTGSGWWSKTSRCRRSSPKADGVPPTPALMTSMRPGEAALELTFEGADMALADCAGEIAAGRHASPQVDDGDWLAGAQLREGASGMLQAPRSSRWRAR